jgi:hypothetical protein
MGMPGCLWPRRFLSVAVKVFIEAVFGHAQVSEGKVMDMVRHAGIDQREREHDGGMTCHGMDALVNMSKL